MKRLSLYVLIFWILVNVYPFFIHSLAAMVSPFTKTLYNSLPYLAMTTIIILLGARSNAFKLPQLLNNQKTYAGTFLAMNILVAVLFIIQLAGADIMQSVTLGLMIAVGFYTQTKANTGNALSNYGIAMAAMFFYMGAKEIPYLAVGYKFLWTDPTIWTWQQKMIAFTENAVYCVPFILVMILYKVQFTKLTAVYFTTWLAIYLIWVFKFDFWSIGNWVVENGKVSLIYHEPINWWAYFINKLYNVSFAIILVEIIKGGIVCRIAKKPQTLVS